MKIMRYELARAIDKVKSIVKENDAFPALGGVLVEGDKITASNQEMTMVVKLGAVGDDSFILPIRSFDLIRNMPEGEIEIISDSNNTVTIMTNRIRNSYQSYPPSDFTLKRQIPEEKGILIPGRKFIEALSRVVFAADDKSYDMMSGVNLSTNDGKMDIAALNGHVVAWDSVEANGMSDVDLIIPKTAVKKLIDMDMDSDIFLTFDKNSAVFRTEEYIIYSRLIEGKYYNFRNMFKDGSAGELKVQRKGLAAALTRAKLCCSQEKQPVVLMIEEGQIHMKAADSLSKYAEDLQAETDFTEPLRIGFDSKMLLESMRTFSKESISMRFMGQKAPVFLTEEGNNLTVLVLPVMLH